jgi:hypothetical protein
LTPSGSQKNKEEATDSAVGGIRHEDTKGHEHHTAAGDRDDIEFPGMEDRLVEFWASADEYWEAVGGDPPRPH